MPTKEQVIEKIKNLNGASRFFGKWEINELPKLLWENEEIMRLSDGFYNEGIGIVVATNRRIIFINKGLLSCQVEDFAYDKISSIQCNKGMIMGTLVIYTTGNRACIDNMGKEDAQYFADYVRARISQENQSSQYTQTQVQSQTNTEDIVSQLERLAKLKEQGILSEEEFAQQKTKILNA